MVQEFMVYINAKGETFGKKTFCKREGKIPRQ